MTYDRADTACIPTDDGETATRTEEREPEKLRLDGKDLGDPRLTAVKFCVLPETGSTSHELVTGIFSHEKNFVEFLKTIIDYCACGLQVVNKQGKIVFINESFKEVHGVREEDVIGRHVTDVVDNTRMHLVAQTGVPEHDRYQDIRGIPYVVSRIPIFEEGECIGAVGLFRFRYIDVVQ